MAMNNLHQPWRAILSMINQCLTGKTSSPTKKDRKDKPHVIPYYQFIKLIICHLGRKHNLHQRSESPLHLAEEDLCLGNIKFIPKGENDEVFGMKIPNVLITDSIRNAPYYNAYLEMVKPAKPSPAKHSKIGKVEKIHKGKSSLQLIDEDEPTQPETKPEPEHQGKGEEHDMSTPTLSVLKAMGTKIVPVWKSFTITIGEEQGDDVTNMVNLEEKTIEIDEGQAGSDLDEEHAQVENPLSLTGTLSSMKNLDAFTFGDQFFNDKPTEEESDKANMETKVKLMVTVPIHQASSYVPLLSTLVIDITPPKPAVHVALQALLRDRFRDLPEADMKEMLHQRMFKSGSYKSHPEHVALYEALEAYWKRIEFVGDESC
ncbi:hypothetical protein Tco_0682379 [Tanacetum coccineum]|uniref:Histone deacetylase 14 n=1 Tax=Tanacetum coccineum TaxID=301880 RepID=A0ABQ4XR84_9ASTR